MVFDEQISVEIVKYGVGVMTSAGKYHFVASMAGENKIKQLCLSQQRDLLSMPPSKLEWFADEIRAIKAFQDNPRACHKCMRAIETIELGLTPNK